eukprot:1794903-Heterocapsa_arctica.AAC.1
MKIAADHEQTFADSTSELKEIAEAKEIFEESTGGAVGQTYSLLQGIGMISGMMIYMIDMIVGKMGNIMIHMVG